jgi:hypothetical protein
VNVQFTPAQIVVSDNRTTDGVTSLIKANSESNVEVAGAIEKVAESIQKTNELQGRRYASYMDRITTQTGLTTEQVTKIIHKKRVYDMIFYTLFTAYLFYILFGVSQMTHYAKAVSMKEWGIKIISGLVSLGLFYIVYLSLWTVICGSNYPIIRLINSAPG